MLKRICTVHTQNNCVRRKNYGKLKKLCRRVTNNSEVKLKPETIEQMKK